jgi:hypothetical protein
MSGRKLSDISDRKIRQAIKDIRDERNERIGRLQKKLSDWALREQKKIEQKQIRALDKSILHWFDNYEKAINDQPFLMTMNHCDCCKSFYDDGDCQYCPFFVFGNPCEYAPAGNSPWGQVFDHTVEVYNSDERKCRYKMQYPEDIKYVVNMIMFMLIMREAIKNA